MTFSPMLCTEDSHTFNSVLRSTTIGSPVKGWVIEKKYDGVRGWIKEGRLYNRSGRDITKQFPEFIGLEKLNGIFDGEIIAPSNRLNDINGRMKMKDSFEIKLQAKKEPARFMCFDFIPNGDTDILHFQRRELLVNCGVDDVLSWFNIVEQYEMEDFANLWDEVVQNNDEGLVLKLSNSLYVCGKSNIWLKVKNWKEQTLKFTTYEEHAKGIKIMSQDHTVNINGVCAKEVKELIDQQGYAYCEVQYMEQDDSESLRFPSFKRLKRGIQE